MFCARFSLNLQKKENYNYQLKTISFMANMFSLEGKNAWITGASYGIGFNIAKAFVGAGIKTIIFNDINEAALERGLANYYHC